MAHRPLLILILLFFASCSRVSSEGDPYDTNAPAPSNANMGVKGDPVSTTPVAGASHTTTPSQTRALLASLGAPRHCLALTKENAEKLVALSVSCTQKPYPNKPGHVHTGEKSAVPHTTQTPAFFGCFDWHSAVHGHFAMARILRKFPAISAAKQIEAIFDAHFNPKIMKEELAFFRSPGQKGFERPYGWGWYFRLFTELARTAHPRSRAWQEALRPLLTLLRERTISYLKRLSVPIRAGTHANTAFALHHLNDYALQMGDNALLKLLKERALHFYGRDSACPTAYEPSGEDFISPCLAEAELMSRLLPTREFRAWFDAFLPAPWSTAYRPLLRPVTVKDLKDPRIGHLIGLSFQRAWALTRIARALRPDDPRRAIYTRSADLHCDTAFSQIEKSGYGGTHWLASFAIYLTTDDEPPR